MGGKGGNSREPEGLGVPSAPSPMSVPGSPADYAPSPNTCSQALVRANQLRVQALLRQLLVDAPGPGAGAGSGKGTAAGSGGHTASNRLSTLRVLRRTMRELDNQLSWLTQVDFFDTLERILRNETLDQDTDWRLIHDTTQLLIETLPRANFEPDPQTVSSILASVVQNLGHQRSEVRRASLLLINMNLNEPRLMSFQRLLRIFIDHGLANGRNKQAQRGAILSLPLLMTEQAVEGEDLMPLIGCLSDLLVESEPQLFYSVYLALQRLSMTLGEPSFSAYLRQCHPDAVALYKQAASRSGSMDMHQPPAAAAAAVSRRRSIKTSSEASPPKPASSSSSIDGHHQVDGPMGERQQTSGDQAATTSGDTLKQVTFEADRQPQAQQVERGAGSPMDSAPDHRQFNNNNSDDPSRLISPASVDYIPPGGDESGLSSPQSSEMSSSMTSQAGSRQGGRAATNLGAASFLDQSSVSSTCSSEANLVDPSHYMNAAALSGHPLDNYDQLHHIDHSNTGLAINDLCVSCSPTMDVGPAAQNELKFGIFPRHLVTASLGPRYMDRLEALQEMMCIIRDSPINHLAILMTYFDSFLSQFLARLMDSGTDYKVELIAIDMIETIVIKTKFSAIQYIRPLVGLLVKSLGDPRALFRDNSVRVIHKMMAFLPPQHVIDAIFEHKHSRSPMVREESANRVTAAVLDYDRNEFNLTKLCYHVLPMLADHHSSVRLAALECIATLAHALGPERIGSLLTAAEAVQTGCDYDGFLDAINVRIMRRTLPRCNADGSIRYVIKPFLNTANTIYHQEHQAADVRWVLEAPSQHQHQHQHPDLYHQHQHEPEFHSHRPGVYSPVHDVGGGPRRCSVPAALVHQHELEEPANHHHHHHHHHQLHQLHHQHQNREHQHLQDSQLQQQQQQQSQPVGSACEPAFMEAKQRPAANGSSTRKASNHPSQAATTINTNSAQATAAAAAAAASHTNSNGGKQQTQRERTDRRESGSRSQQGDSAQIEPTQTNGNNSEIGKRRHSRISGGKSSGSQELAGGRGGPIDGAQIGEPKTILLTSGDGKQPPDTRGGCSKRSNSQDSGSSTGTNKVLFQYYLGKFRQSLEDNGPMHPVLPSDSLIYTDVVQAYELHRHQSRYQQTSFDYDSGPVGRVPVEPAISKSNGSRKNSVAAASHGPSSGQPDSLISVRARLSCDSAGSESSGSESPQTIMEQVDSRKRSGQADDGDDDGAQEDNTRRASRHSSIRDSRALASTSGGGGGSDDRDLGQDTDSRKTRVVSSESLRKQSRQLSEQAERRGQTTSRRSREEAQYSIVDGESSAAGDTMGEGSRQRVRSSGSIQKTNKNSSTEKGSHKAGAEGDHDNEEQAASEQVQQQQQQPRARALVRQSASAAVADEHPADIDDDGPVDDGDGTQKSQHPPAPTPAPQIGARQESTGTTDSHSSNRSDHATQTPPVQQQRPQRDGEDSRQSRRRRSSRVSRREEPTKGGDDDDDENQAGNDGNEPDKDKEQERRREQEVELRRRASRSQPPPPRSQQHQRHLSRVSSKSHLVDQHQSRAAILDTRRSVSVSPSVATNVNIRHILENVADSEGPFQEPQLAFRVAMEALSGPCWSTKVEGILALIRLAAHHQQIMLDRLHEVINRVANETRNLRSTVARSAIFALGDFCAKLERSIEPEMETIVQALLHKSIENTAFIREDIRRALTTISEHLTQWRLATALIAHGTGHKNMHVRRMASQFVALMVEKMGPAKCLVGARDISAKLIPAAAKFAQDSSPHTRYYGRLILARIMHHSAFERLLRKNLTPNLYRSTVGIVESIKRRGAGDPPAEA